jgi:hypothetical protein
MAICKRCGKKAESEFCFRCKPRKKLVSTNKRKVDSYAEMLEFFLMVWSKRTHVSEVSGEHLGKEPLTVFFHHILPKEKYPEAAFDEENIILLTLDEHTKVENDMYKYEEVNKRREQLKIKYGC